MLKTKPAVIIASIVAAWMFFLSDYLLDMRGMFDERFYQVFENMSYPVAIYAAVSALAFPFLAMGLAHVLRAASLRLLVPVMVYFLLTVPIVIHTSFIYYYYVVTELGMSGEGKQLLDRFDAFKNVFGAAYFAGVALLSLALLVTVAMGKSVFPRYFALVNPIVGIVALNLLKAISPALGETLHPLFVPATFLAFLMTLYGLYLLRHRQDTAAAWGSK
ncbi:MAG: hypothetical protein Q4P06_08835 [Actinomycetaceae bacterium]|nr:hypothetical protein [Actinomycetaceae bacterium]